MTGLFIAAVSYFPVYAGMRHAAGTRVVTVSSVRDPVTGVYGPAPQALISECLTPAGVATRPDAALLFALAQVIVVALTQGPLAAYLCELPPEAARYTSVAPSLGVRSGERRAHSPRNAVRGLIRVARRAGT